MSLADQLRDQIAELLTNLNKKYQRKISATTRTRQLNYTLFLLNCFGSDNLISKINLKATLGACIYYGCIQSKLKCSQKTKFTQVEIVRFLHISLQTFQQKIYHIRQKYARRFIDYSTN